MAKIEILLPAMGEGIIEATITKWLVKEGDKVEEDQSLVEVATDKVDSEIPAPEEGVIEKLLFNEDDIPKVGDTIAILSTNGSSEKETVELKKEKPARPSADKAGPAGEKEEQQSSPENIPGVELLPNKEQISSDVLVVSKTPGGKFLSPLVRNIAQKENVSIEELDKINGSGNTGRITKNDIINYVKTRTNTGIEPLSNVAQAATVQVRKPEINKEAV